MKVRITKANAFGIAGIIFSLGIVGYSVYKASKDKKEVDAAIQEEHLDEQMIKCIKEVSSPEFSNSKLERTACQEVLEGYRKHVLKARNLNEMRSAYLHFTIAYEDMKSGTGGIYFRCRKYLDEIKQYNRENEETDVGDLLEIVLKVTQTGVKMLS